MRPPPAIRTERLDLVVATLDLLRAELVSREAFAAELALPVSPEWPPGEYDEPAIRWVIGRLEEPGARPEWWFHYLVRRATATETEALVGCAGYKGPPDESGTVEVGYSVLPGERRRGYAAEATRGLVAHAFAHPGVRRVIAETMPQLDASIGVLDKCGFTLLGPGSEEGSLRFELVRAGASA